MDIVESLAHKPEKRGWGGEQSNPVWGRNKDIKQAISSEVLVSLKRNQWGQLNETQSLSLSLYLAPWLHLHLESWYTKRSRNIRKPAVVLHRPGEFT